MPHTQLMLSKHIKIFGLFPGALTLPPSVFFLRKGRMSQIHWKMGINTTERLEAPSLHLHNSFMPSRGSINGLSEMLWCILQHPGPFWALLTADHPRT